MQLRKWIDLLDSRSAWEVGVEELALAGIAMIDNGYAPGTVNRNFSQLGSVYRWAKQQRLTPVGFISPTLSQHRYEELMRHIFISDEEVQRLITRMVRKRREQLPDKRTPASSIQPPFEWRPSARRFKGSSFFLPAQRSGRRHGVLLRCSSPGDWVSITS